MQPIHFSFFVSSVVVFSSYFLSPFSLVSMIQYVPHASIIIATLLFLKYIVLDQENEQHILISRAILGVCTLIQALLFLRATKNVELIPGTPESKLAMRSEIKNQWLSLFGRVIVVIGLHVYSKKLEPLIISNIVGFMMLLANKTMMGYIKGDGLESVKKPKST